MGALYDASFQHHMATFLSPSKAILLRLGALAQVKNTHNIHIHFQHEEIVSCMSRKVGRQIFPCCAQVSKYGSRNLLLQDLLSTHFFILPKKSNHSLLKSLSSTYTAMEMNCELIELRQPVC